MIDDMMGPNERKATVWMVVATKLKVAATSRRTQFGMCLCIFSTRVCEYEFFFHNMITISYRVIVPW